MFCSNQLGNNHQRDLSGPGIDVKLKERKKGSELSIFISYVLEHVSCNYIYIFSILNLCIGK